MSDKKHIFLSYSRKDSKFALHLASDLKKYGFDVWIDQINIPGGEHWDDNIEKALNNSCALILLLSPSSVASNRVKDEVSYALENNIHIIPIRYKDTSIPYRWQRLQSMEINEKNYDKKIDDFIQNISNFATCKNPTPKQNINKPANIWYKTLAISVIALIITFLFVNTKDNNTNTLINQQEPKDIITTDEKEDINTSKKISEKPLIITPKIETKQQEPKYLTPTTNDNIIKEAPTQKVTKTIKELPTPKSSSKQTKTIDTNDPYQDIYNRYQNELKKDKSTKLIIISHTNSNNEYDKAQEKAYEVSLSLRKKGIKRSNIITKVEMDGRDRVTFDFRKTVK